MAAMSSTGGHDGAASGDISTSDVPSLGTNNNHRSSWLEHIDDHGHAAPRDNDGAVVAFLPEPAHRDNVNDAGERRRLDEEPALIIPFFLHLKADDYGGDTGWNLKERDNPDVIVASETTGVYGNQVEYFESSLLKEDTWYTFTITDQFGDGICCGNGEGPDGFYKLFVFG